MPVTLDTPPPPPPNVAAGGAVPPMPMGGMQMAQMSPGTMQISNTALRMGMEIDQALKLLAQAVPQLTPWVARVTQELRVQLGEAVNAGMIPTGPAPAENSRFPGGAV